MRLDQYSESEKEKIQSCSLLLRQKRRRLLDANDYEFIEKWIIEYRIEPDLPAWIHTYLRLKEFTINVKLEDIDSIIKELVDQKIYSVWEADEYFKRKQEEDPLPPMISACGELFRKRFDGIDLEYIEKWAKRDKWDMEVIRYAYAVLHRFMNRITVENIDERLSLWKSNGVNSLEKAKQFEARRLNESKKSWSHSGEWESWNKRIQELEERISALETMIGGVET